VPEREGGALSGGGEGEEEAAAAGGGCCCGLMGRYSKLFVLCFGGGVSKGGDGLGCYASTPSTHPSHPHSNTRVHVSQSTSLTGPRSGSWLPGPTARTTPLPARATACCNVMQCNAIQRNDGVRRSGGKGGGGGEQVWWGRLINA
jgi:hypothetical protein